MYVFTIEIVKKPAALTNHFKQTSSACMVGLMLTQVVR
jgi:hypothetical protein